MEILNHANTKKINKALGLLSKAAADKKEEMSKGFNRIKKLTTETFEDGSKQVRNTVADVNRQIKKNPWTFVGGIAAGAVALGYLLGVTKKK